MNNLSKCIYGAAIGDALGVPYEFLERETFTCDTMAGFGTHNKPAGTWSDDTSMLLGTCRSIKDCNGTINTADMLNNFKRWLNTGAFTTDGNVFDVGNATYVAVTHDEPQDGEFSNGNGSLMRIAPLAFIDCTDDDVRAVSAITHAHWISQEACVIFVNLLRDALDAKDGEEAPTLAELVHGLADKNLPHPFDRLHCMDQLTKYEIESTGYVVHTLEAAIWCVLTSNTYEECLLKAVNLGSDTDTTACVAGALGSVKFDLEDLPQEWFDTLLAKDLIEDCLF